jgi:hypothetical protein
MGGGGVLALAAEAAWAVSKQKEQPDARWAKGGTKIQTDGLQDGGAVGIVGSIGRRRRKGRFRRYLHASPIARNAMNTNVFLPPQPGLTRRVFSRVNGVEPACDWAIKRPWRGL